MKSALDKKEYNRGKTLKDFFKELKWHQKNPACCNLFVWVSAVCPFNLYVYYQCYVYFRPYFFISGYDW